MISPEQPLTVILPPALMLQTPSRSMMVIGTAPDAARYPRLSPVPARPPGFFPSKER